MRSGVANARAFEENRRVRCPTVRAGTALLAAALLAAAERDMLHRALKSGITIAIVLIGALALLPEFGVDVTVLLGAPSDSLQIARSLEHDAVYRPEPAVSSAAEPPR
jgi:hypothetical protein